MSDPSDSSDRHGVIPRHGGYRNLRSFQTAQLVYDATVIFCGRFVDTRSRTHDQMVQAARSGVQNIAEGSMASATSREGVRRQGEVSLRNLGRGLTPATSTACTDRRRPREPRRTSPRLRRFPPPARIAALGERLPGSPRRPGKI
jgi:hypothetical protein